MKTKLKVSLLLVVLSVSQIGCGIIGSGCPDSHMVGKDVDLGLTFDVELEGHSSASAAGSVFFEFG